MAKQYTYKRAFLGFSESSIRGYSRPKFKTIRVKVQPSVLDRIDEVVGIHKLGPAQMILLILCLLTGLALGINYLYSLLTAY